MTKPIPIGLLTFLGHTLIETVNCKACDESNKICGHNNTTAHYWDTSYYTTKMVTKKNTEALEELENKTVSHTKVKEGMVQVFTNVFLTVNTIRDLIDIHKHM